MRHLLRESAGDSTAVCLAVHRWLEAHPEARVIGTFAALPGEPDLLPLVAAHPERTWAFPTVRGESLTFHPVADVSRELTAGSFGIREPMAHLPELDAVNIDAFLCPGLAFTASGGRLGRGRGFYDRMLALARPEAVKLGVCFPFQLVEDTFGEAHDVKMDGVIGES